VKFSSEFRDSIAAEAVASKIASTASGLNIQVMEVCGTHTMSIARFGIKSMLPEGMKLVSGPGCPVCVTPNSFIDHAVALSSRDDFVICTFGDMVRVPGSFSSLEAMKSSGGDVRVVYSPMDALHIAEKEKSRQVVFLGVGFETTAPTVAAVILEAAKLGVGNFSVLCAHKTIPSALGALMDRGSYIDAFLLPGHVSVVIGVNSYKGIFEGRRIACAVSGFEPLDILSALLDIVEQIKNGRFHVSNCYGRAVSEEGNVKAQKIMREVFEPCDSDWRGLGVITGSGLRIKDEYSDYDAFRKFHVDVGEPRENPACRCGEVLTGAIEPTECTLFGTVCTPSDPVGACMVSSEGTCAAYYRYVGRI